MDDETTADMVALEKTATALYRHRAALMRELERTELVLRDVIQKRVLVDLKLAKRSERPHRVRRAVGA